MPHQEAAELLCSEDKGATLASWALRFTLNLEGVLTVLSGMSDLQQVRENISVFKNAKPLTNKNIETLQKVVAIYKKNGPMKISDFSKYAGLLYHGVPVSAVLDCYNTCQFQPNPHYGCDNIYLKNTMAEETHLDCFGELPKEKVILDDGTDITEIVEKAEKWLIKNNCG